MALTRTGLLLAEFIAWWFGATPLSVAAPPARDDEMLHLSGDEARMGRQSNESLCTRSREEFQWEDAVVGEVFVVAVHDDQRLCCRCCRSRRRRAIVDSSSISRFAFLVAVCSRVRRGLSVTIETLDSDNEEVTFKSTQRRVRNDSINNIVTAAKEIFSSKYV